MKTVKRCYRGALQTLGTAIDWWTALADAPAPSFIAQLGDVLDGRNAPVGKSRAALDAALAHFARTDLRALHVVGNQYASCSSNRRTVDEQIGASATHPASGPPIGAVS